MKSYNLLQKWHYHSQMGDNTAASYDLSKQNKPELNKNYYVVRNAGCARSRYTLKLSIIFLKKFVIN